jgi:Outer membrane protein beta-barrel domain
MRFRSTKRRIAFPVVELRQERVNLTTTLKQVVLLWFLLVPSASELRAQYQSGQWGIGFRLGASRYDLDGSGTGFVLGPQADYALNKALVGELAITLFDHYTTVDFGGLVRATNRTRLLLPELSLQAQATLGPFQPYLFAGGGVALRLDGSVAGGNTLHAGIGTRVGFGGHTMLRFEARSRAIRHSAGETLDLTVGIEWAND